MYLLLFWIKKFCKKLKKLKNNINIEKYWSLIINDNATKWKYYLLIKKIINSKIYKISSFLPQYKYMCVNFLLNI